MKKILLASLILLSTIWSSKAAENPRYGILIPISQTTSISIASEGGQITANIRGAETSCSYDYAGRIDKIGDVNISYDYAGRAEKVGDIRISYDYASRVEKVDTTRVSYDYASRIERIGDSRMDYDYAGRLTKVSGAIPGGLQITVMMPPK